MCMLQVKCERYWSEEVGGAVEVEEADLKATTTSITTHRDFVIRTMTLKNVSPNPHAVFTTLKLTIR